jgi:hypothetical protein
MSTVTIGFVPRERFSLAAEALQRIFEYTRIPFNLIVVDCNIPRVYWHEMERVLSGRKNVKVLRTNHYLLPNQSHNLVIRETKDDFVCLIENDVLVNEHWLSYLIAACEEHPADVAVPLILEGRKISSRVHFAEALGSIRQIQHSDGVKLEIVPRGTPTEQDRNASRRTAEFIENHCMLFKREVFDRIGPFDEAVNTREPIDLSMALYHAKVPVVFEPKCRVGFLPPPPVDPDESDFYFFRWDLKKAIWNNDRIKEKWNLVNLPSSIPFVKERNLIGQMPLVRKELMTLISPEERFVLVDEEQWRTTETFEGLRTIPFLERDGKYWGRPTDDETAIRELERLRQSGAGSIVFVWSAFWWLDHYTKFNRHIRSAFRCVLSNDRLVVFDLQSRPDQRTA